jgi:putative DNA primase/helicase
VALPASRWDADPDLLPCRNGVLHIPTRSLQPHAPKHYLTTALPYDYDPEAVAETWQYLLDSTVPHAAQLLQEFAGYALTTSTRYELALWLLGQAGGGKSTLLLDPQTMLGARAGLLSLADVERSRFALANLPGKTLVVSTEQPADYIASAATLNAIISGEPVLVDRKFRDAVTIIPRAKIAWAMNSLPRVGDSNSGLFRRVRIIEIPPRPKAQRDPAIKEAILHEGPGILNWALDGLTRLTRRGYFEVPDAVELATEHFQQANDVPAQFVAECCVKGEGYRAKGGELYKAYATWCKDTGHKPQSLTSLANDWDRLGFDKRISAGVTWRLGIGLKADEQL